MSYHSVGITDETLIAKANTQMEVDVSGGGNPMNAIFNFIDTTGLKIQEVLSNPKVQEFMREAEIKAQDLIHEQKKREKAKQDKNRLLLFGGAAAVVGFLLLRRKGS